MGAPGVAGDERGQDDANSLGEFHSPSVTWMDAKFMQVRAKVWPPSCYTEPHFVRLTWYLVCAFNLPSKWNPELIHRPKWMSFKSSKVYRMYYLSEAFRQTEWGDVLSREPPSSPPRRGWQAALLSSRLGLDMIRKESDCTWAPIQTACHKKDIYLSVLTLFTRNYALGG